VNGKPKPERSCDIALRALQYPSFMIDSIWILLVHDSVEKTRAIIINVKLSRFGAKGALSKSRQREKFDDRRTINQSDRNFILRGR